MPQMKPINWMMLYILLNLTLLMINIMNYFNFNIKINYMNNKNNNINNNWKW